MTDFKVEKERVAVKITMTDGSVLDASLFLAMQSSIGMGRQTLREVLEDETKFIPVNDSQGAFALVGKSQIACIMAPVGSDPTPEFTRRVSALFKMKGAGELEGQLIVPEGPAAFRVSDYLNSPEIWFRVEDGDNFAMLPKASIKEIRLG